MMKPPTEPEAKAEKRDEFASRHVDETRKDAQLLRAKYNDAFLAMFAKPSTYNCLECAEDYVARGVREDHPMLRHAHFTTDDLEGRPDLELAIAEAKRATKHPLESVALPRSGERTAVLARRVRESIQNLAQRTETARHDARVENPSQTTSETYRSPQVTV